METIIELQEIEHKNERRYFLFYDYTTALNNLVRALPNATYSATHRTWHLPLNEESITKLRNLVNENPNFVLKKRVTNATTQAIKEIPKTDLMIQTQVKILPINHLKKLNDFKNWMLSKRYSPSSIDTYCDALRIFWFFFTKKKWTTLLMKM